MAVNIYLSRIISNVFWRNALNKRHRITYWIKKKKQEPTIYCLWGTHFRLKDTHRLKVGGWKKIFHANRICRKIGLAILISDKVGFKAKSIKKDKNGMRGTHLYLWLIHVNVWQKPAQYCKVISLQLKKNKCWACPSECAVINHVNVL